MHEHLTRGFYYVQIQLLYASAVWIAAWIATSARGTSDTAKYWIWVATSVNFIVPVGAIVDVFSAYRLTWARPLGLVGSAANAVSQSRWAAALALVWLAGAAVMAARLLARIRAERRPARRAGLRSPAIRTSAAGIPVELADAEIPAVDGILRPRISLPEGIDRLLTEPELDAVLIHEATHAKRRDNLIRLVHEIGLCVLWFHPLVWIAGRRIALYREISCDESVIRRDRGRELVSALAKLAVPGEGLLLQSSVSSHVADRLVRLAAPRPDGLRRALGAGLAAAFGAILLGGVLETVAHTACCFLPHH